MIKLLIPIFLLVSFSCSQRSGSERKAGLKNEIPALNESQKAFMQNLAGLCGKSFTGKEVYSAPGRESWDDKKFIMHVSVCDEDRIHIPFHVDDDESRTWMFLVEDSRLRFRHDHRHPDGTPEELTLYGGYATDDGTPFRQHFPSDQYTDDLLKDNISREWRIILAGDMSTFTYELHYKGERVFAAEFDLKQGL